MGGLEMMLLYEGGNPCYVHGPENDQPEIGRRFSIEDQWPVSEARSRRAGGPTQSVRCWNSVPCHRSD
jgi:hypothetical protein